MFHAKLKSMDPDEIIIGCGDENVITLPAPASYPIDEVATQSSTVTVKD
jgi:hypothetical protein